MFRTGNLVNEDTVRYMYSLNSDHQEYTPKTEYDSINRFYAHTFYYGKMSITLTTPFSCRIQKYQDDKGTDYLLSTSTGEFILIRNSPRVVFTPYDYYCKEREKRTGVYSSKTHKGKTDGKYWRRDVFSDIRVYYGNVSRKRKKVFDEIFDKITVSE